MTRLVFLLLTIQSSADALHLRIPVAPAETVHVAVSGEGETIVLVPGLLGAGFAFRKVVDLLNAAHFRTIAVDLLGTGQSSRPTGADYSLDAQADRIAAVMDSLGVTQASVVAHAIGGSIALRLALRNPDRIDGLLLLEAGPAESATTPGLRKAMKMALLIRLFGAGKVRGKIRDQMIEASGDASWVEPAVVQGYTEDAARDLGATLDVFRAMARSHEREPLSQNLAAIRQPVVLLLGGAPHTNGPPAAEVALMAGSLAFFKADTLPGVGHFPHEEAPALVRDAVVNMRQARVALNAARSSRW